ncbi:MAG: hypothetical protein ABIE07_07425 [Candidatus Zixiibacteriota bacterium]
MRTKLCKYFLPLLGLFLFIAPGCYDIVSGTFIVVETFEFTAHEDFYFYQVDVTDDATWQKHKDNIDFIDAVGAEFFITNTTGGSVTFNAYIDDYSGPLSSPTSVPGAATKIIDEFTVAPGVSKISYKQSLSIITGVDRMKALAKKGQFDYYGISPGHTTGEFVIDSAKIIITVSGSE